MNRRRNITHLSAHKSVQYLIGITANKYNTWFSPSIFLTKIRLSICKLAQEKNYSFIKVAFSMPKSF